MTDLTLQENIHIDKGVAMDLFVPSNLPYFKPNQVTNSIAKAADINPNDGVFEIGAGIGGLTLLLARYHSQFAHMYTVEIVPQQVEAANANMRRHGLENRVSVLQGSLFDPIEEQFPDLRADVIIGDCSGMTTIGQELGWYPPETEEKGGIPSGGDDGTSRVIPFLERSPQYGTPKIRTYFPVAPNFSDAEKIKKVAQSTYKNISLVDKRKIPLTQENLDIIDKSKTKFFKPIERKGSRGIWTLEIYLATDPIK
jgi:SAM-dependent methyltransferase